MQADDAGVGAAAPLPCLSELGELRQGRLHDARLLLVTDARTGHGDLGSFLDAVLGASVDVVRLRDPGLGDEQLAEAAAIARRACDRHGALLLLDDRAEPALAAGADGIHVGRRGPSVEEVRAVAGPDLLLGRSTRDVHDLAASGDEDLDHVTVPADPTAGRVTDLTAVQHAAARSPHLWFAVGGIDPTTIGDVLAAGARRVAVGGALTRAEDPVEAAWTLRRALARYPLPS